jgi:hypothetical protein
LVPARDRYLISQIVGRCVRIDGGCDERCALQRKMAHAR